MVSSSLAIGLAQTGPRAVAVDLDLGGANLHTLFGCERARHTLADFARGRVDSLEDALVATTVPGVRLLSGARAALDARERAARAEAEDPARPRADRRGSRRARSRRGQRASHTLDAFVAADRRILVVTPEATAIENAYHFLKAAFFRALRDVAREPERARRARAGARRGAAAAARRRASSSRRRRAPTRAWAPGCARACARSRWIWS